MAARRPRGTRRAGTARARRRRRHRQPRRPAPSLLAPVADVVATTSAVTYPQAVRIGLDRLAATAAEAGREAPEWVWLLHDDSRPAPGALAALLAAAAARPDVDVLGPKLREWPSLRRLLEVGVTISGTGRRETGLERGEYDQGQHDDQHEVLAVNTAGMLVRRRVLEELDGFDDQLPLFGNDLDFGWRAAAAGHTTLVVPDAVVFHAEAAHRGIRRTQLTGRHTHYQERRAALYTLLVNSSGRALPWRVVRLTLRHVPADAGLPAAPVGGRGARRPRRAGLGPLPSRRCSSQRGANARRGAPIPSAPRACSPRPGCPTGTGSTSAATSPRR